MPDSDDKTDPEPRSGSSRRWPPRVGLFVVLVVVAPLLVWLVQQQGPSDPPPSVQSSGDALTDPAGARAALARRALERQSAALKAGSQSGYLAVWDSTTTAARRRARTTYANLRALGIGELDTRHVAVDTGLSLAAQQRLGGEAWTADVEVGYQLAGFDQTPARSAVSYTFVKRGARAYVVDVRAADGQRQPIWSLGRLDVRRSPRTLVAATSQSDASRVAARLRQAVRDVEGVLPEWDGTLVAYVAGTGAQLEALLAVAPGSHDRIAAVTTTVDGSTRADAPLAIIVNAAVFTGLGPIGRHVVITHEATHAATDAAVVGVPLWVAEGFADYVAVGAVDLPLTVSARVVMRDVRRHGVPERLPSQSDFGIGRRALVASYEQAWLAIRLIATTYGERALIGFHTSVVNDPGDVEGAFRDLGTTERAFTKKWRAYLAGLAR